MERLQKIQARAIALRSSIHNEHQLSAIELTAMCAKKTNELIDVINDFVDIMNEFQTAGIAFKYNEETESLEIVGGATNG